MSDVNPSLLSGPLFVTSPTEDVRKQNVAGKRRLSKKQRRFVAIYFFILLIAFSPSKALGFVTPLAVVIALIFFVQLRPFFHLQVLMLFGIGYVAFGCLWWLISPQFWWPNYLLIIVTYASWFMLL